MVKKHDYCGLHSGRKVDKSAIFENFFGELQTAPMIKECPVSFECRVIQSIERPVHTAFIGQVKEVYFDENCLTNGAPNVSKIDPILFSPKLGTKISTKIFFVYIGDRENISPKHGKSEENSNREKAV